MSPRRPSTPTRFPAVYEVGGRPVTWLAWRLSPCRLHAVRCPHCRPQGTHWVSYGSVQPAPGEQWHLDGRTVAARSTLPLVAYSCARCGRVRVVDLHRAAPVSLDGSVRQLALFELSRTSCP